MNSVTHLVNVCDTLIAEGITPKVTQLPSAVNKKRRTRKSQRKTTTVVNTQVNYDSVTPKRNIAAIKSKYAAQVKSDRKSFVLDHK